MTPTDNLTFVAIPALVATYEVTKADGIVIGVIAEAGPKDWRVLTTRRGEPARRKYRSQWAAAVAISEAA